MSQTETAKAVAAEERTEEARSFVRRVRTATRRKYTPEEKIRIVLEGFCREVTSWQPLSILRPTASWSVTTRPSSGT